MIKRTFIPGFTLVEVLTVVVILSILAGISYSGMNKVQLDSRDKKRESNAILIVEALEQYYTSNNEYPTSLQLNPSKLDTELSDFSPTKSLLPSLEDDNLKGPSAGNTFWPDCSSDATCGDALNDTKWSLYHAKQYIYMSVSSTTDQTTSVAASKGGNTGWGCSITRSYSDPSFALAYRRESDGVWVFYKSRRGPVTITDLDASDTNACVFTKV